jgi:hypothetical protein
MSTGKLTWKDARNSAGAVGGDGIERAALISEADSVKVCWVEWERDRVVGVMLDNVKPM